MTTMVVIKYFGENNKNYMSSIYKKEEMDIIIIKLMFIIKIQGKKIKKSFIL